MTPDVNRWEHPLYASLWTESALKKMKQDFSHANEEIKAITAVKAALEYNAMPGVDLAAIPLLEAAASSGFIPALEAVNGIMAAVEIQDFQAAKAAIAAIDSDNLDFAANMIAQDATKRLVGQQSNQ